MSRAYEVKDDASGKTPWAKACGKIDGPISPESTSTPCGCKAYRGPTP